MIVSHTIKPFRRFGVVVSESLWINGMPYFTAKAIAEWLELKGGAEAVDQIIRRNPYISRFSKKIVVMAEEDYGKEIQEKDRPFKLKGQCPLQNPENAFILEFLSKNQVKMNETFTCPCLDEKSKSKGKRKRKITLTVFDPIGLQLITMESHSKKAIEYKIAVAKVIWAIYNAKLAELNPEQESADRILELWANAPQGSKKYFMELYEKKTGKSRPTAYRDLKAFQKGESPIDKKWKNCIKPAISGDTELRIRELFIENPSRPAKELWKMIGSPKKPSYYNVKVFVRKLRNELGDGLEFTNESEK